MLDIEIVLTIRTLTSGCSWNLMIQVVNKYAIELVVQDYE